MNLLDLHENDGIIRNYTVKVAEPDLHDPSSDSRRLEKALVNQHTIFGLEIPLAVLATLQKLLRKGNWHVLAALNGHHLVSITPLVEVDKTEFEVIQAGLLIDIGVSSIEAHLVNLHSGASIAKTSLVNPLVRFGVDPISRIAHGMSSADSVKGMMNLLRQALDAAVGALVEQAGLARDAVLDILFVADPVTHHLVLGLDPTELGSAPYTQTVSEPLNILARDFGVFVAPGAFIHALPLLGGQVGSDSLAAAFQAGVGQDERVTLLIDIGTTTEIVLGSKGRIFAAAPPAGTALEGVQIEAGRHAVPGAIEAFEIDPTHFEPRFRVMGSPLWSDEPGFATATEALDLGGFCRSGLIDALAQLRLTGLMTRDGALDPNKAVITPRIREEYRSSTYLVQEFGPRIALTQHDIRTLQMAKAAVQASARILLKRHGGQRIERVVITGGTGASINPLHAAIVGLFPDCDLANVEFIENAAMQGGEAALLNPKARAAMAQMAREIRVVETVLDPDFQNEQIAAMGLPHSRLAYPLLAERVVLADNEPVTRGRRTERRSR